MKIIGRKEIEEMAQGGVFRASKDMILTPLAKDWAHENNVLIEEEEKDLFTKVKNEVKRENPGASDDDIRMAYMEVVANAGGKKDSPNYYHRQTIAKLEKAVVSVTGKNRPGIVAKLTDVIAQDGGNLLDIQQTIVNEFFTMVLVVDISTLKGDFAAFRKKVLDASKVIGVDSRIIHEGVLHAMHRI